MKKIHLILIVLLSAIIALQIYIGFFKKESQATIQENIPKMELGNENELRNQPTNKPANNPYLDAKIESIIIPAENNTWGYELSINGVRTIRQLSIPGLAGNNGFKTKAETQKVIDLVIKKIRKNIMPPTITNSELDSLKINLK